MYPVGGTLSDTCPQWGVAEVRRICPMYAVADDWSHMSPVGMEEERSICGM